LNRRRFLKHAGATGAVIGASALGLDLLTMRPTSTPTEMMTSTKLNLPPVAEFSFTPNYLNPTDQQIVRFTSESYDLDGDSLAYKWMVDGEPVSEEKDYSAKLPVGRHFARLEVSDGYYNETTDNAIITIEPDQIYPTKQLRIKYKGMDYAASRVSPELDMTPSVIPDHERLDEQLSTIHDELGCNAVSIWAGDGYEDNLIEACRIALQKRFDRIYVLPKYMHFTVDEIAEKLAKLAPRITSLRETSDKIVWVIGNEFTYCVKDLIPGDTFRDKQTWVHNHHDGYIEAQQTNIPRVFETILPVIRKIYRYPVAYNAGPNEIDLVPWNDPLFESVCWNAYLKPAYRESTEKSLLDKFSQLKRFRKPIIASEFGCATWTGAGQASDTTLFQSQAYDEDEQADSIDRHCMMFNDARIDGAFLYIHNEEWDKGFGLYNGKKRKKGFYMYKSYQRAS